MQLAGIFFLQLTLVCRLCRKEPIAYYRIANHYRFIMQQMFDCRQYDKLILVEDDMLFAPDFFGFFEATAPVLEKVQLLNAKQSYLPFGVSHAVSHHETL